MSVPKGLLCLVGMACTVALAEDRRADCRWDRPGERPYMGEVPAAVDRYTDLPADVRARLKARMSRHDHDDLVVIRRDSIEGRRAYATDIRDMHFGSGQVCGRVTRAAWKDEHVERALVYCDGPHCVMVPTVCRNVSRVSLREDPPGSSGTPSAGPVSPPAGGTSPPLVPTALPFSSAGTSGGLTVETPVASSFSAAAETSATSDAPSGVLLHDGFHLMSFPPAAVTVPSMPGDRLLRPAEVPVPPVLAVPEPGTVATWAFGLAALATWLRRRRLEPPDTGRFKSSRGRA